jgi:hypothetical protein
MSAIKESCPRYRYVKSMIGNRCCVRIPPTRCGFSAGTSGELTAIPFLNVRLCGVPVPAKIYQYPRVSLSLPTIDGQHARQTLESCNGEPLARCISPVRLAKYVYNNYIMYALTAPPEGDAG